LLATGWQQILDFRGLRRGDKGFTSDDRKYARNKGFSALLASRDDTKRQPVSGWKIVADHQGGQHHGGLISTIRLGCIWDFS
jgi:hypothetical protein